MVPVSGEPYVWAICLPILLSLLLCDVGWGLTLLIRSRLRNGRAWLICMLVLSAAIAVDFAHH
jgi:hypothetical protein